MAEVGESTGALQEMLNTVADFYDEEISTTMDRFITLVEPVLLVFMGLVIAGLLLALYMPLSSSARCCRKVEVLAAPLVRVAEWSADLQVRPPEAGLKACTTPDSATRSYRGVPVSFRRWFLWQRYRTRTCTPLRSSSAARSPPTSTGPRSNRRVRVRYRCHKNQRLK